MTISVLDFEYRNGLFFVLGKTIYSLKVVKLLICILTHALSI